MILEAYESEKHDGFIRSWLEVRKLSTHVVSELPGMGVVAFFEGKALAAGFVRRLERTRVGMLDSYITDQSQPPEIRHQALKLISDWIVEHSKIQGITQLLGMSVDGHTIERSLTYGFQRLPHTVFRLVF